MEEARKKRRDNARYRKYGGIELVRQLLSRVFSKNKMADSKEARLVKAATARGAARKLARSKIRNPKKAEFLAQTILRHAVGEGYLRPEKNLYLLTKKGMRLLTESKT